MIARNRQKGIHLDRNVYIYTYVYISTFCINHCWANNIMKNLCVTIIISLCLILNLEITYAEEEMAGIHYKCDPTKNELKIFTEYRSDDMTFDGPFKQFNNENSALFAFDYYKGKLPIKKLCKFRNKNILSVITGGRCPSLSLYLNPSLYFIKSDKIESNEKPFLYSKEFGVGGCRGTGGLILGDVTVRQHPSEYHRGLIIETK